MKYIVFDCDGTLIDPSLHSRPLYPGILSLLEDLRDHNYSLYVWTARDRFSTLRILTENQILSFFDEIFTIDDGEPKPHPDGLEQMLAGKNKESICVIGDSHTDILGAKNFGVMSIAALWNGITRSQEMKQFSPDFLVNDPEECSKVISDNLKGDGDV